MKRAACPALNKPFDARKPIWNEGVIFCFFLFWLRNACNHRKKNSLKGNWRRYRKLWQHLNARMDAWVFRRVSHFPPGSTVKLSNGEEFFAGATLALRFILPCNGFPTNMQRKARVVSGLTRGLTSWPCFSTTWKLDQVFYLKQCL